MRVPSGDSARSEAPSIAAGNSNRRTGTTADGLRYHATAPSRPASANAAAAATGAPRQAPPAARAGTASSGRDKMIRALDAATGKVAWTFATRARVDSSPVVAGGRVYIGSSDNRLYALDVASGQKVWEFDTGAALTASPAVAAGKVVIGSHDGRVYAFG